MNFKSLSGRFLVLTIIFVMLAEVLIFVPSVARFRLDYLQERLERAQIAAIGLEANPTQMISAELEAELLENAGVLNIVLERDSTRELVLMTPMPTTIAQSFDLRTAGPFMLIWDTAMTMAFGGDRVIQVLGEPVKGAGIAIEAAMDETPLRAAIFDYGWRILILSLVLSVSTSVVLFFIVRLLVVRPIDRLVGQMQAYQRAPEDSRLIVEPDSTVTEIYDAETALNSLQTELSTSLRQKERLAALGSAVTKISHDLRNMLTTAQLLADTMEMSDDPRVQKRAPKLVTAISRAVSLCEGTLNYSKAEDMTPMPTEFSLNRLIEDVVESERLALGDEPVEIDTQLKDPITIEADQEQLFRITSNLVRNARQVLSARSTGGQITVTAAQDTQGWTLGVEDNGPGLPKAAQDNLFKPFAGSARRGGSGLGLAISSELARGHGGKLDVVYTGDTGTRFEVWLPRSN